MVYVESQRPLQVDIERVENGNLSFILDINVDAPILSRDFFTVFLHWTVPVYEILDVSVDKNRHPSTARSIKFHGLDSVFVVGDSDLNLFAGNGAKDFICERLFQWDRSQTFFCISYQCKWNWKYLIRIKNEFRFLLLHEW